MNDQLKRDLEGLLGESPLPTDPAAERRRAVLAQKLAAAFDADLEVSAAALDPALMAAHIDGSLDEAEKQALLRHLDASPMARADLESAAAFIELLDSAPERAPEAVLTAAGRHLERRTSTTAREPRWLDFKWLLQPKAQLGFGIAAAALLVMVLIRAPDNRDVQSNFSPQLNKSSAIDGVAAWAAIAGSRSKQVTGTANSDTREAASDGAIAACNKSGASDCALLFADRAQCAAVAVGPNGALVVFASPQRQDAMQRAAESCERSAAGRCHVLDSVCGH
jgi:hypothetical protein